MKLPTTLLLMILCFAAAAQQKPVLLAQPDSTKPLLLAEASCGQCKFGLKGSGCSLAVRMDGKAYYVDGAGIDDFGDAHAADGFCEAIRKAKVQGEVVNDRFELSYFKLVETPKKKEKEKKEK